MRAETKKAVDEWQAEIERLRAENTVDQSALTCSELAAKLGWGITATKCYVHREAKAGRVVPMQKIIICSDGRRKRVPAWKRVKGA